MPSPSAPGVVTDSPLSSTAPPAPGSPPAPQAPGVVWYGWQGIIGQAGSLLLFRSEKAWSIFAAGYFLWSPFVHLRNDRPKAALASLALRVGVSLLSLAAVSSTGCANDPDNDMPCMGEALVGLLLGGAAVTALDDAVLSRRPADSAPGPLRLGIMGGVIGSRVTMPAGTLAIETDSSSFPLISSFQITVGFGEGNDGDRPNLRLQVVSSRVLVGLRVVRVGRGFVAAGPLVGLRETSIDDGSYHPDYEFGLDLGGALWFRLPVASGFSVGAGLLGYGFVGTDTASYSGSVVEAQAGVMWSPD